MYVHIDPSKITDFNLTAASLVVSDGDSVNLPAASLVVNDGDTVNLTCRWEKGNPPRRFVLRDPQNRTLATSGSDSDHLSKTMPTSGPDSDHLFKSLSITCSDSGLYRCEAEGLGEGERTEQSSAARLLLVRCTPTAPTVSGYSIDSYIEENSTVNCTCSTTSLGQPAGRLVWRRVGAASPVAYGDYGNNRLVVSQTLLRSDHDVTQFRCDVDWASGVSGHPLTFKVGYKPEGLSLSLNSGSLAEATVRENTTVTLTCVADSRPAATMTVNKDGLYFPVRSDQSPFTLTLDPARCTDTGTYVCSGSNQFGQPDSPVSGKVYVMCSPRSPSTDLPALNYRNESTSVTFDVTAYPPPRSPFTFAYLGPGGADPPSLPSDVTLTASCGFKTAAQQHLFVCTVVVLEMTSGNASGVYTVSIANSEGSQLYRFNVAYNLATPPTAEQRSEGRRGVDTVTVVLAVVLTVVALIALIVLLVLVVWVCRRRGRNEGAGLHNVELQEIGGRHDDDDDDQNVYNEILDDPPPAADLPGEFRQRRDQTLPAVPRPAPRPIKNANSLSGQRRAGIARPPTSLNQSTGVDSAARSRCITPTATGGTAISSSDLSDYLIPIPITLAALEKKSPDDPISPVASPSLKKTSTNDLSDMSIYLTPVAPPSTKKTSSNYLSDMSTYLTPVAPPSTKKTSSNDLSDMSTYLTPVASPSQKKTSPNDLSDMSIYLTPVAPPSTKQISSNDLSDMSTYCPTIPEENIPK